MIVFLLLLATDNPMGLFVIISAANDGPDIRAILVDLLYFLNTSIGKRHVSCSIPLVAIQIYCFFIKPFNSLEILSTNFAGTAINSNFF